MKSALLLWVVVLACGWISAATRIRHRRAVSTSLGDVLGIKPSGTRRKKPIKVTPPLRLKPGETAEQAPGWQHCIKNIRAGLNWRSIKSPGYPDFLESQIQCSWIIEAPIGMKVKLAFRDLDMIGFTGSCAKQFVQIIDVGTGKSQGRFCGGSRPGDYVTLGTKARVDLQADKAVTKVRGFFLSYAAVNEIPGFRSSKSFPSLGRSREGAPGRVNVKNFLSTSKQAAPKPSTSKRRGNKPLVYESDRRPAVTDPSASTTESGPADALNSEDDLGWIGDDEQLTNDEQTRNNGNRRRNSPAKVVPTNQKRVLPPGQRPTARQYNGPLIFTPSTLPVRIRASPPAVVKTKKSNAADSDPVIYGKHNQPLDPGRYTTLHPVRLESGKFIDHRDNNLSTTNVVIIVACAVLFVIIIVGMATFLWLLRKRRKRRRQRKKAQDKKRKGEEDEKRERMELNVARLIGENPNSHSNRYMHELNRPNFLPGQSAPMRGHMPRHSPDRLNPEIHFSSRNGSARNFSQNRANDGSARIGKQGVTFDPGDEHHSQCTSRYDNRRHAMKTVSGPRIESQDDNYRKTHASRNIDAMQQGRFHSLDPRALGSRLSRVMGATLPSTDYSNRNTMPDPRQYHRSSSNAGPDEIDEDYCSGSGSESGKAPMRREYSPWELEQQKKDRRKKLMAM